MDKRKLVLPVMLLALVLLSSCSVVFEAGVSGRVVTVDGTETRGVANVSVFAYTDKSQRDSDFTAFVNKTITRPSSGAGYVASTTTSATGDFTVNKIVWETKKSEFGKTADVGELYLIFYHKDYSPAKTNATIISGSTNSSNIYQELESNKDYASINVTILDVATGRVMVDACTMEYKLDCNADSDTRVVTGTESIRASFEKGPSPSITFALTTPGSNWKMTKSSGEPIDYSEPVALSNGTQSVTLYMKNYEFILPGFSGSIDSIDTTRDNANDNVQVWLEYKKQDGSGWEPFDETVTAYHKTRMEEAPTSTTMYYRHGQFNGVGANGYSIVIDEANYPLIADWSSFTGKILKFEFRLGFGDPQSPSGHYEFDYTSLNSPNLGHITVTP